MNGLTCMMVSRIGERIPREASEARSEQGVRFYCPGAQSSWRSFHPLSAPVCYFGARSDRVSLSGDHGSKYRVEVIGLGRRDRFKEPQSWFQERLPRFVAPLIFLSFRQAPSGVRAGPSALSFQPQPAAES